MDVDAKARGQKVAKRVEGQKFRRSKKSEVQIERS